MLFGVPLRGRRPDFSGDVASRSEERTERVWSPRSAWSDSCPRHQVLALRRPLEDRSGHGRVIGPLPRSEVAQTAADHRRTVGTDCGTSELVPAPRASPTAEPRTAPHARSVCALISTISTRPRRAAPDRHGSRGERTSAVQFRRRSWRRSTPKWARTRTTEDRPVRQALFAQRRVS